jgi:hypothetical protein
MCMFMIHVYVCSHLCVFEEGAGLRGYTHQPAPHSPGLQSSDVCVSWDGRLSQVLSTSPPVSPLTGQVGHYHYIYISIYTHTHIYVHILIFPILPFLSRPIL